MLTRESKGLRNWKSNRENANCMETNCLYKHPKKEMKKQIQPFGSVFESGIKKSERCKNIFNFALAQKRDMPASSKSSKAPFWVRVRMKGICAGMENFFTDIGPLKCELNVSYTAKARIQTICSDNCVRDAGTFQTCPTSCRPAAKIALDISGREVSRVWGELTR